jgi:hypothetical protein
VKISLKICGLLGGKPLENLFTLNKINMKLLSCPQKKKIQTVITPDLWYSLGLQSKD